MHDIRLLSNQGKGFQQKTLLPVRLCIAHPTPCHRRVHQVVLPTRFLPGQGLAKKKKLT